MKVVVYPAVSLDGFIADVNGDSDWVSEEDGELFEQQARQAGCVIVGRKTYDQYKDEIFPIKDTLTIVVTSLLDKHNSSEQVVYMDGKVPSILDYAASKGYQTVLLAGGGELNGLFAAQNAVDEAIVSIYPRVMGDGVRVFGSFKGSLSLKLVSSTLLSEGVIQNRYEVVK